MQKKVQFTVKDASEAQNMASKLLKEKNNFSLNLIGENTDKSLNYEAVYEINLTLIGKKFLE
jgi:DNA-dependent RNA polymerase auxiliary subunit epsilon